VDITDQIIAELNKNAAAGAATPAAAKEEKKP
jgi:hypothetical protein